MSIVKGEPQNYLSFDGVDDYVETNNNINNITTGDTGAITVEATFKGLDLNNIDENSNPLFWFQNSSGGHWFIRFENQKLWFRTYGGNNNGGGYTFNNNQKYTVALVWDVGNYHKLYVDGVLINTYNDTDTSSSGTNNYLSIATNPNLDEYFNGEIYDVRIWNDVRTDTEIANNYNVPLTGNESNLALYYNFSEGSGNTLNDLTSNNYDATIVGATWQSEANAIQNIYYGAPISGQNTFVSISTSNNSYVDVGDTGNLFSDIFTYDTTISFRIRFADLNNRQWLWGGDEGGSNNSLISALQQDSNTFRLSIRDSSGTFYNYDYSVNWNTTDWFEIEIEIKDYNDITVTIDGVIKTPSTPINVPTSSNWNNSNNFKVGQNPNISSFDFRGDFDYFTFTNTNGDGFDLQFNEGSGSTTNDSLNNFNGTLVNATWGSETEDTYPTVPRVYKGQSLIFGEPPFGSYELLADVEVQSNTTQIDFDNLNITKDDELVLRSTVVSNASGFGAAYLFVNDNTTEANYYTQTLQNLGYDPRSNRPLYLSFDDNKKNVAKTKIKVSNEGRFIFQVEQTQRTSSSDNYIEKEYAQSTFTITSINKLTIITRSANEIGQGSRFTLYKVTKGSA